MTLSINTLTRAATVSYYDARQLLSPKSVLECIKNFFTFGGITRRNMAQLECFKAAIKHAYSASVSSVVSLPDTLSFEFMNTRVEISRNSESGQIICTVYGTSGEKFETDQINYDYKRFMVAVVSPACGIVTKVLERMASDGMNEELQKYFCDLNLDKFSETNKPNGECGEVQKIPEPLYDGDFYPVCFTSETDKQNGEYGEVQKRPEPLYDGDYNPVCFTESEKLRLYSVRAMIPWEKLTDVSQSYQAQADALNKTCIVPLGFARSGFHEPHMALLVCIPHDVATVIDSKRSGPYQADTNVIFTGHQPFYDSKSCWAHTCQQAVHYAFQLQCGISPEDLSHWE